VNTKPRKTNPRQTWTCTKCLSSDFDDKESFYVHILECGDPDWDTTSKKSRKKAKKSKNMGSLKPLRRANSLDGTESGKKTKKNF
jgi:hypothetical protein